MGTQVGTDFRIEIPKWVLLPKTLVYLQELRIIYYINSVYVI